MAITLTASGSTELRIRNAIVYRGKLTMDNSYPTGGESVDSIAKGLDMLVVWGGTYVFQFVPSTNKLKAMKHSGTTPNILLVEEDNAVDLSAQANLEYFGIKLFE